MEALEQLMSNLVVIDISREAVLRAYADVDTYMKRSGTRRNEQNGLDRGHRRRDGRGFPVDRSRLRAASSR
jgi:hypothetical protein